MSQSYSKVLEKRETKKQWGKGQNAWRRDMTRVSTVSRHEPYEAPTILGLFTDGTEPQEAAARRCAGAEPRRGKNPPGSASASSNRPEGPNGGTSRMSSRGPTSLPLPGYMRSMGRGWPGE